MMAELSIEDGNQRSFTLFNWLKAVVEDSG
jgi:hypothetical protein